MSYCEPCVRYINAIGQQVYLSVEGIHHRERDTQTSFWPRDLDTVTVIHESDL